MTISLGAANALENAIDGKIRQAATPRRRASGTVSRVDKDGTVYAVLESGIETVVEGLTASVNPGDTVNVTIEDGRAEVLGNYTDPSAGVKYVRAVEGIAQEARATAHAAVDSAAAARQVADEAQKVAEATNQHFFADTNGAHITDVTQDEWTEAVDDNFSDYDPDTKPYHNQLLNSLGILLRTALNNLVSITRSAIAFYDGTGNAASNIVARFGSDGAQIGLTDESHLSLDYRSMQMMDGNGVTYLHISDLRDNSGYVTDIFEGDNSTTTFTLSARAEDTASMVVSLDGQAVTSGITKSLVSVRFSTAPQTGVAVSVKYLPDSRYADWLKAYTLGRRMPLRPVGLGSMAEGYDTTASGGNSHAEGFRTVASGGDSHAEGYGTVASGSYSHAEGYRTTANAVYGACSHAEGAETTASGGYSHAEGYYSVSSGNHSHAEGSHAVASGADSHAQNNYTIAASANQTAIGKYNLEDANDTYALIIGNGTADNARSNALAVTWDGAIESAADTAWITLNGTIKYRIHHGVCYVCGDSVSGGTSVGTSGTTVGTLPTGARPSIRVIGAASTKSNAANGQFSIDSSGVITVWNLQTSSPYWCFTAAFPVG